MPVKLREYAYPVREVAEMYYLFESGFVLDSDDVAFSSARIWSRPRSARDPASDPETSGFNRGA